ncbi:hypothetical protein HMPREF9412_1304 [Paenibacillus sp. HGF5]|nr:hypothetical protein HMPREF9412_1304 [Paenibacillus sp. HGF5]
MRLFLFSVNEDDFQLSAHAAALNKEGMNSTDFTAEIFHGS